MDFEIERTPDPDRRYRVQLLATHVHVSILVEDAETQRAQHLEKLGFHYYDALHIACAESRGADVFLTTDDRLLRLASRRSQEFRVLIKNPLVWLQEMTEV